MKTISKPWYQKMFDHKENINHRILHNWEPSKMYYDALMQKLRINTKLNKR